MARDRAESRTSIPTHAYCIRNRGDRLYDPFQPFTLPELHLPLHLELDLLELLLLELQLPVQALVQVLVVLVQVQVLVVLEPLLEEATITR